jgi:hypothetical protein
MTTVELTTTRIREILNQHRDKMTVQLDPPTDAKSFWMDMLNTFEHVIYDDDSKKWGKNHDKWRIIYHTNSHPADVCSLNQLAFYFPREGFPLQNGKNWEGDDLSLVNKSGRLLKRFNKFIKLATGHDIDSAMQGKIGDKLQYFVNQAKTFVIDFHDSIDWQDGMYGHSGSCWFPGGCYEESSEVFDDNGGWSIRFYRDMDDTQGIGRTWIVPMDDGIVAFNCYGPSRAEVSKIIKKVFAGHDVELHYKSVSVYNSNDNDIPYVNSGTGFVLAESGHDFLNEDRIDLDWEVSGRGRYSCDHCGDRVDEDYTYSGPGGDGTYCESCYNDRFSTCEKCCETFDNDDVHSVSGSHYDYLCEYCLERIGAVKCEDCGDWVVDDYHIMQDSGESYCESCADHNTKFTCQCGERFEYAMDEGQTCESCDYVYCDKCNEMVQDTDDHNTETHPGDDAETTEQDDTVPSDVMQAVEMEVTLCRADNDNKPTQYTLKVYCLANVPGLFVYDEHTLDKSSDHAYHVMHQCGLAARSNVPHLEKAIAIMQRLGTLTDWDKSQDAILAEISAGLGSKAGKVIQDILS